MLPSLADVYAARDRIRGTALRTPLVRLNVPDAPAEIYLKLENLQPIGSFKIRGAINAMRRIPLNELQRGVLTASAGNMAQGVAYGARTLGVPCTVICPDTAPVAKTSAVERLGGRILKAPFETWWRTFEQRSYPGVEARFIHAFDDPDVIAGNGTIAFEIIEDLPDADGVIVPWGGGGLASGIANVMRSLKPACRMYAAEVATAAPLVKSLAEGSAQTVAYQPSFVDGIGSKSVFANMFHHAQKLLDGSLVAPLDAVRRAVRLIAERNRVIAEGAGACATACALMGAAGTGKIVCIVSGGNIDLDKFAEIVKTE